MGDTMGSSAWQCNRQHHGQQCMVAQWAMQQVVAHGGATDDITGSSAWQRNGRCDEQQHMVVQWATPRAAAHNGTMGNATGSSAWWCNGQHDSQQRMACIRSSRLQLPVHLYRPSDPSGTGYRSAHQPQSQKFSHFLGY